MKLFSEAAERIAATSKRLEKTEIVAGLLASLPPDDAATAAIFLSGRPFPAHDQATLQIGGALLWRLLEEISGRDSAALSDAYRRVGDAGAVAAEILPNPANPVDISLTTLAEKFRAMAGARGPAAKTAILRPLMREVSPLDVKYIIKIVTGDLRNGMKESLMEDAIAKAYGVTIAQVQRANMLLGDIGETLRYASTNRLSEARMRLFHPLGFMLATPAEDAQEALSYFAEALVEDKFDGIRAQAHIDRGRVEIFSRTRDSITASFPELVPALASLPSTAILDGEIVAWSYESLEGETDSRGRALPFSRLQQRLGRKRVAKQLQRDVPVAYLIFDVLFADGALLIDEPLTRRNQILDDILSAPRRQVEIRPLDQSEFAFHGDENDKVPELIRSSRFGVQSPDELDLLFDAAQARGNEGLMIKDPRSAYTPGRRGRSWLKMKRELATLDVVVTAVEHGHGRRIHVLSDYTFAVWDGDRLVNIGKAYSGLTDAEIEEMTRWFHEHTIGDYGLKKIVEPKIVLEVAFNNMMRSDRHESGLALRFPRIVRLRPDKLPSEADTVETARSIYEKQSAPGKAAARDAGK